MIGVHLYIGRTPTVYRGAVVVVAVDVPEHGDVHHGPLIVEVDGAVIQHADHLAVVIDGGARLRPLFCEVIESVAYCTTNLL